MGFIRTLISFLFRSLVLGDFLAWPIRPDCSSEPHSISSGFSTVTKPSNPTMLSSKSHRKVVPAATDGGDSADKLDQLLLSVSICNGEDLGPFVLNISQPMHPPAAMINPNTRMRQHTPPLPSHTTPYPIWSPQLPYL
ncbi:unnamed protein product [Camellia sinensis]